MAGAWNDQLIQHHPANQIKLKFRACPFHTATTIIGAEESHTIRTFLLHVIVSSRVGWGKVRHVLSCPIALSVVTPCCGVSSSFGFGWTGVCGCGDGCWNVKQHGEKRLILALIHYV